MSTRIQVKAIIEAAVVAVGAHPRGATVNGVAIDGIHAHNDILVDALFNVIERFSYNDFHNPTSGLPTSPAIGDVYIATATANGWTDDNIYTWNGSGWDEQVPQPGWLVWVNGQDDFYKFTSSGWQSFTTIGTHYHSSLAKPGETTPSWYVDTDGGLVAPDGWRQLPNGNYFELQKWDGAAWQLVKRSKYVP